MHWLSLALVFFMLIFGSVSTTTTDSIIFAEDGPSNIEKVYLIDKMPSGERSKYFQWIQEGDRIIRSTRNKIGSPFGSHGAQEILALTFYAKTCYERAHMILMRYKN